jgi:hypothetical protein
MVFIEFRIVVGNADADQSAAYIAIPGVGRCIPRARKPCHDRTRPDHAPDSRNCDQARTCENSDGAPDSASIRRIEQ